ncbi:MAG: aspartate kinase [Candidatus Eisenbacteria bacterium]|nr:aspartate kinase [Candidatus Eisenbacteria bacterium]
MQDKAQDERRQSSAACLVMKFGGTSLATPEAREAAAARVAERKAAGEPVVVVVSAMGRGGDPYATDSLLGLVRDLSACPARERDALMACGEEISAAFFAALLNERHLKAVSLRGFQAGIVTDDRHQDARIVEIRTGRIRDHLAKGEVVVVAGFQGITRAGDIATIGRGGSDTTAVALGVALDASRVEIFTDVDGVRTADPRIVPSAERISPITFEEAAELAHKGATVLHPRAAELAREANLPVTILTARPESEGTRLMSDAVHRFDPGVRGCAVSVTSRAGIAQARVHGADFRAQPHLLERLFKVIAERGVTLDMMGIEADRVVFTLEQGALERVRAAVRETGLSMDARVPCAKVTLVGGGIHGVPGVMHRIVRALTQAKVTILQSVDSNMIIGVLVDAQEERSAVRAIHAEFFEAS